jgi:hypothetical protein
VSQGELFWTLRYYIIADLQLGLVAREKEKGEGLDQDIALNVITIALENMDVERVECMSWTWRGRN